MPVFLSHKREDKEQTLRIAGYLKQNNVNCYVDVFDPGLQTTDDITKILMERIGQCTHLMAVVSGYTEKSWWVPFEIGVGSEKDRRITSFQLTNVSLPDFLTKWPILKNQNDLDTFIQFYKQDTMVSLSESVGYTKRVYSADQFHRELKARL
ncbi:toll/interleukin-1 receptor domain-containing protein [Methylocucumis oryzae]|uniref:TIR domain-containing protein n=1 Tax=Methylocucumis oryzae TaxID=1632867 RepID=A0A0F3II91_9GAMM|nr:toll/interleukin-1 receptor domain-containing protein [Methylocucumis oryzae]KJV05174.1 hypothetical protein VZ94_20095 [Methylocucumis oryzae]